MGGSDPENGHGAILVPPRQVRSNKLGTQQSVDPNSESFLEKKQKLFKYARDKEFKLQGQFKSLLAGIETDEEKRKLCQSRDDRGNTALHYAVKAGNMEVCKQLRKNGADINARGQNKMKPLQFAARYGDEGRAEEVWTCMQWIMEEGRISVKSSEPEEVFDVQETDKYDFTLLHHAIQNTNWEETPIVARKLLQSQKFKVTDVDRQGNTSLHLAAEFDKQENHTILDVFLEEDQNHSFKIDEKDLKACIETRNKQGKTPLHIACGVGNPDSVRQLLDVTKKLGIHVPSLIDSPDNDGQHPLHLAIESGNLDIMNILMNEGVIVSKDAVSCADATDSGGSYETPLFIAAQHNRQNMVRFLMSESKLQGSANSEGVTPLMVSVKEGNTDIVQLLLRENSTEIKTVKSLLEEKDNDDRSVFHYAFESRKPAEVTQILVEVNSKVYQQQFASKMKDFLTMKDLNEDTPFHILVQQKLEKNKFDQILKSFQAPDQDSLQDQICEALSSDDDHPDDQKEMRMTSVGILECMKEKNETKETPLHKAAKTGQTQFIEAILDLNRKSGSEVDSMLEQLLKEKDENGNTPLHLATQRTKTSLGGTKEVANILLTYIRDHTKDQMKYLTKKNSFGWTPFSGAVSGGDLEMVEEMLQELTETERRVVVNQPDFSNTFPLHLAAKYGHVGVFKLLLDNKAELNQRGRDRKTALEIAIVHEQRMIIQTIIEADEWIEAFQIPSTSDRGDLETPLRKLIRSLPDMAEKFLDRCCEELPPDDKDSSVAGLVKMNADFIEDTHKYLVLKNKKKERNLFCHRDRQGLEQDSGGIFDKYQVDINNHPMVIMADERKEDLLQHPLCIAIILKKWSVYRWYYYFQLAFYLFFLTFLNLYAITSPSPIDNPELFTCSPFFRKYNAPNITAIRTNSIANDAYRWILIAINVVRVFLFFLLQEQKPIINRLKEIQLRKLFKGKRFQSSIKSIPFLFLLEFVVYALAFYIAINNSASVTLDGRSKEVDVRECAQWQITAFTVTLAWLNLLFYMRLLYVVGKYIILFQDVLLTFMAVFSVVFILVIAFAAGFFLLLHNRKNFSTIYDSLLKTMIMMSGEFNYFDIFFKGLPPQGFGDKWSMGHENVPFPSLTYFLFVIFFFLVSIVALNVLVGLTVDDIRIYLENADRLKLSMRLRYMLATERGSLNSFMRRVRMLFGLSEENETQMPIIKKRRIMAVTNDLISKAKICEMIDKKQEERRRKSELEQEKRDQSALVHEQTRKIKEFISTKQGIVEKVLTSREIQGNRRKSSTRLDRQMRQSSFGDNYELAKNINVILSYMEESSKELNEVKMDVQRIIQHLSSEVLPDRGSSSTHM